MSIYRERIFSWESRVPDPIIWLLLFGALIAMSAIGFFGGSTVATSDAPIAKCTSGGGATRLNIPTGQEDDVTNPPRIAPRG